MKIGYYFFLRIFQLTISFKVLKLALNKNMCASDDEQSIKKLDPY